VVLEGLGHLFHEEQPVVVARHILDETASLVSGSSVGVDGNV
jgi:pimeloyl-ACP methyl ester carboxylesterase